MKVKALVILSLAALSLVAGSPGTVRRLEKEDKKKEPAPVSPKSITVTRHKGVKAGRDGLKAAPDEVDINAKLFMCEKEDEACQELKEAGEEVTEEEFGKRLADSMMAKLGQEKEEGEEKEEDEDGHGRQLGSYHCHWNCEYIYYCDCCYCWIYYDCWWVCHYH